MTRTRNAVDFLHKFRAIRAQYEKLFGPHIAKIRQQLTESCREPCPEIDQSLEAHIRQYVVNAFLSSLNWRMGVCPTEGLPNLVPETPITSLTSSKRSRTRFLDYLGLDAEENNLPLMIVETKRPSSELPGLESGEKPASTLPEIVERGLAGELLTREWSKWLADLRDYVSLSTQI